MLNICSNFILHEPDTTHIKILSPWSHYNYKNKVPASSSLVACPAVVMTEIFVTYIFVHYLLYVICLKNECSTLVKCILRLHFKCSKWVRQIIKRTQGRTQHCSQILPRPGGRLCADKDVETETVNEAKAEYMKPKTFKAINTHTCTHTAKDTHAF